MSFWKDPAHIRTLILYLLVSALLSGICFYNDLELGIIVAVVCAMFTIFRMMGDLVYHARTRLINRRAEAALRGEGKPSLSDEKRGALYELDGNIYKLAIRLSDCEQTLARERAEDERLMRGIAAQIILRAEELPVNVHRRELIALAHDVELLSSLGDEPISQEEIAPVSAADVWADAMTLAGETLRMQHITVNAEIAPRAYVTTCPRDMVVGGVRGLLESCARHADVGAVWECHVRATQVFTEFRISSDRLDWSAEQLSTLFTGGADAEPALTSLSRLAAMYHGEVRAERVDGAMCHLIFRLYQSVR